MKEKGNEKLESIMISPENLEQCEVRIQRRDTGNGCSIGYGIVLKQNLKVMYAALPQN